MLRGLRLARRKEREGKQGRWGEHEEEGAQKTLERKIEKRVSQREGDQKRKVV